MDTLIALANILIWIFIVGGLLYGIRYALAYWEVPQPFQKIVWAVVIVVLIIGILRLLLTGGHRELFVFV